MAAYISLPTSPHSFSHNIFFLRSLLIRYLFIPILAAFLPSSNKTINEPRCAKRWRSSISISRIYSGCGPISPIIS